MELDLMMIYLCACMCLVAAVLMLKKVAHHHHHQLPPCPPALPILGHLHLLLLPLHHTFHKLSLKHGPYFFLWMGSSPAVVISSHSWVKEFLHTHDRQFADRPPFEAGKRIFYNSRTLAMIEHGPKWRDLRKLYTVHMLTSKRVEMLEACRLEEMALFVKFLEKHASSAGEAGEGAPVDMKKLVFKTMGNMMTRMLFGKRSFDASDAGARFKELVEETAVLLASHSLGDLIPWLGWLDVQGLRIRKRMDKVAADFDAFFEEVLAERMASQTRAQQAHDQKQAESADYLDILLHVYGEHGKVDKDSIKCILLDFLSAGIESTMTAIEWTLAELITNQRHLKKLQQEVDTLIASEGVAGNESYVINDCQVAKLTYLQAIVKETLRLHPPFPFNVRQMSKEYAKGIKVGGYHLPKKTRVFINLWTMARDCSVWGANADMFCPDRFLLDINGSPPDLRGHHFEFLPFGTGRRGCPGMSMALTVIPFVVANLVLHFNWDLPQGATLDLSKEGAGFAAPLAKPLVAIPILRHQRS